MVPRNRKKLPRGSPSIKPEAQKPSTLQTIFKTKPWLLPFVLSASVTLVLAGVSLRKPLGGDEVYYIEEIRSYAHGTYSRIEVLGQDITYTHVPGYPLLLSFLHRLFGENFLLLRSIGVAILCVSLFLFSYLPFQILPNFAWAKRVSWITTFLIATHPVLVQGSVILDYDATFFLLFLTLFCFFGLTLPLSKWTSILGLSSLFALCLWGRTGSALILLVSWPIWFLLMRPVKLEALRLLLVQFFGLLLFSISWVLFVFYSWGLEHLFEPFAYLFDRLKASGENPYSLEDRLQDFARLLLWFGIPWLFLFAVCLFKRIPKSLIRLSSRLTFLKVVVFFGIPIYHVVGRSSWGYPKYLNPFIPISTFLFVVLLTEGHPSLQRKEGKKIFLFAGACLLLSFFFVKDPLYELSFVLKKAVLLGSPLSKEFPKVLFLFGAPLFFLLATFLALPYFIRRRLEFFTRGVLSGLLAIFSTQVSFAAIQAFTPYTTTSCYGDVGLVKIVEVLKRKTTPTDFILAPMDTIPYFAGSKVKFLGGRPWEDPSVFLQILRESSPKVVVYSIATLPVSAYRKVVQNPEVQKALSRDFSKTVFGEYVLWLRKEAPFS